jgi:hypothetical protein
MGILTKEEAARGIVEIIRCTPRQSTTGPHLGAALKYKLESFRPHDFGVPTLKSFIKTYVPEVEVTVNSPTEVLYTLKCPSQEPNVGTSDPDGQLSGNGTTPEAPAEQPDVLDTCNVRLPSSLWFALVSQASKKRAFRASKRF